MKDTKPVFDSSRSGERVLSQRHDQPGEETFSDDLMADFFSHDGKTVAPDFMREDRGWRPEGQLPVSILEPQEDPGKVYTAAEIQATYPDGYVPGAPSLHHVEGSSYRFPEARPTRICG